MEETCGAQYALHVALQTLKDRCQHFQQRIEDLETENLYLRSKCMDNISPESSATEIDALNKQITQLTEQKVQLSKKVEMVTAENNSLWARLSEVAQVKENLDTKLVKIKDTISSRTNLVRSKTFTQDEPHIVFCQDNVHDESNKISLELEDISLKLLNSIAKEKLELEMHCSQMTEMQTNPTLFSNSYAFVCSGEETTECDELEKQLTSLTTLKMALLKQKEKLELLENVISIKSSNSCIECRKQKNTTSTSAQTSKYTRSTSLTNEEHMQLHSLANWGTPEDSLFHHNVGEAPTKTTKELLHNDIKICPICSKTFDPSTIFSDFEEHVEHHFILESDLDYQFV